MSVAGFAVGLLYGVVTHFVDRLGGHRAVSASGLLSISPIVIALLGIVLFVWLAGTLRLPQKRGMVFIVCIFPGAMVELLLSAIVSTITRTIA